MQFLFLSSFATLALAGSIPALFERQTTCSDGGSVCGSSCYNPQAYLCCNTDGALCAIGSYCSQDADGNAACCANGQNCVGPNASGSVSPATSAASSASGTATSTGTATSSARATPSSVTCSGGESVCGSGCYDPTSFVCCSQGGVLCGINQYCTLNSLQESVCCAEGFNCNGEGSSTASAQPATTVPVSGTATAGSSSAATTTNASSSAASTTGLVGSASRSATSAISSASSAGSSAAASGSSAISSASSSASSVVSSAVSSSRTATGTSSSASSAAAAASSTSSGAAAAITGVPMYIAGVFMAAGAML